MAPKGRAGAAEPLWQFCNNNSSDDEFVIEEQRS